jgi:hypothetical protein
MVAHGLAIVTCLMRAPAPDLMVTADFDTLKCLATTAMSSAFALPSTGGDLRVTKDEPLFSSSSWLSRLPGLTLILMTLSVSFCAGATDTSLVLSAFGHLSNKLLAEGD